MSTKNTGKGLRTLNKATEDEILAGLAADRRARYLRYLGPTTETEYQLHVETHGLGLDRRFQAAEHNKYARGITLARAKQWARAVSGKASRAELYVVTTTTKRVPIRF